MMDFKALDTVAYLVKDPAQEYQQQSGSITLPALSASSSQSINVQLYQQVGFTLV